MPAKLPPAAPSLLGPPAVLQPATSHSDDLALRMELMVHPAFRQVALRFAAVIIESYRTNRIANRLFSDRGRFCLGLLVVALTHRPGEAVGFTPSELKAEAAALEVCSPGRADAFLATLRLFELVEATPDRDRRRRRLMATEKLMALHRARWKALFAVLGNLAPDIRCATAHRCNPLFAGAYVRGLLTFPDQVWRPAIVAPELLPLLDHNMGPLVPLALLETAHDGAPLHVASLARSFLVSRSHMQKLLEMAERGGLAMRPDARSGFVATPTLVRAAEIFIGMMMARQVIAARQGLAAICAEAGIDMAG